MNSSILKAFLADQRVAKEIVSAKLGIPEDIPALEWSLRYCELRDAYNAAPFAEIFNPHGYGLELKIGDLYIDYDYSESGRPDGFDAWRIFVYLTAGQFDNSGPDRHLSDRVGEWFRDLIDSGYIVRGDNLYYVNDVAPNPSQRIAQSERRVSGKSETNIAGSRSVGSSVTRSKPMTTRLHHISSILSWTVWANDRLLDAVGKSRRSSVDLAAKCH